MTHLCCSLLSQTAVLSLSFPQRLPCQTVSEQHQRIMVVAGAASDALYNRGYNYTIGPVAGQSALQLCDNVVSAQLRPSGHRRPGRSSSSRAHRLSTLRSAEMLETWSHSRF